VCTSCVTDSLSLIEILTELEYRDFGYVRRIVLRSESKDRLWDLNMGLYIFISLFTLFRISFGMFYMKGFHAIASHHH